jgi:hypothetical protein
VDYLSILVRRPQPANLSREERLRRPRYRMPDAFGGAYQPRLLTISSDGVGATIYRPHEPDPNLEEWERLASDFNPAGITEIDMTQLVGNAPAAPYTTLPEWAGLAQLVRDGKLRWLGSDRFRVLTAIDAPVGLYGSEAVTFELAPGVPPPRGDLGHSRIR